MSLSIKVLNMSYLNQNTDDTISPDDPTKNINNLSIDIVNVNSTNGLSIKWNDCSNPNWKSNIIVKASSHIPINAFNDKIVETTFIKDQYSINGFLDNSFMENTLYCYRIFTQFTNSDEYYSGFKNIFFVYAFDSDKSSTPPDTTVIQAGEILLDSIHQFVTQEQINKWNNIDISHINPNAIVADSTHRFVTDEQINKWDSNNISNIDPNIILTDSTHRFLTDEQINSWNNINPSTIITDITHRFVTDAQISKWDNMLQTTNPTTQITADNVLINDSLGDNFNPKNVEDALKQLFTFVVNNKIMLASAINDKSEDNEANPDMSFQELIQCMNKVDNENRQNIILNINNKFDLSVPIDSTYSEINNIINNIMLDSIRKTVKINSTIDLSTFYMQSSVGLNDISILFIENCLINSIIDLSTLDMEVII